MTQRKLGKHPPKHDPRTFQFKKYVTAVLPVPPQWHYGLLVPEWGVMANDTIGDCTCAAAGHGEMNWSAAVGAEYVPSDQAIIEAYSAITGFDPKTGANDNGAACLDVLNYWRKTGIGGKKIVAYAQLDPSNPAQIKRAIAQFGLVYLGISLPVACQHQPIEWRQGTNLSGQYQPGSWGGHAIIANGYDDLTVDIITWGERIQMTWEFFSIYCDEAYVILSDEFMTVAGTSPMGFALSQLETDLSQL